MNKSSRGSVNNIFFHYFNTDEAIEPIIDNYLKSIFRKKFGLTKKIDMIRLYRKLTRNYHILYYNPAKEIFVRFKLSL